MAVLLGLDVGDKRIGVALSDALGVSAHPLCTLTLINRKLYLLAITDMVSIPKVERVIIGLPISLDDTIGTQAQKIQKFARKWGRVIDIPIDFGTERCYTV